MVMKYLGIILILFILFGFLIIKDPILAFQENFDATTSSNVVSSSNVPNSVVPNVVVPNTITGTLSDPSVFSASMSNSGGSPGYVVTSSNVANSGTDTSGNTTNVNTSCDPTTLYSMKNIMQDKSGNIIVRYMDTCGKYYTYEYTQSIQGGSSSAPPQPPTAAPPTAAPAMPAEVAASNPAPVVVDANTINNLISNALAAASSQNQSTPTPLVLPT
jgi:hypothetical protein